MTAEIKIVRQSLNVDWDDAFGLIFKLAYVFRMGQPRLVAILDNDVTRSQDWAIYGERRDRPDLFRHIDFDGLGEVRHFELGRSFKVEFCRMSLEEIEYARTGKSIETAYHFKVDALNADSCRAGL